VVHQHGRHHQRLVHLHHQHIFGALRVLSDIHHHSLSRLIHWHGHGHLLVVGAADWWRSTILHGRGWLLPSHASRWVVGNWRALLRALLLLGATIGWSVAGSRGQDGLMHSGNRSTYDVGMARVRVVHRTWFATCDTGVIVVNITTVGVTVIPILPMFVGSGRTNDLLLTAARTVVIHGWLLWETTAIALPTTIACVVVGEHALLLSRGVATAWGLLANSHAELAVCKLVLHCD
jgi:hypothetical protein